MIDEAKLLGLAKEAAVRAYAPYSEFRVGAAIQTADGGIYTGVNIENASFGLTLCAERAALAAAITDGQREFISIAVAALDRRSV
ncbi:MAG: cytidine deaminase [Actinomycetota bacterium]